MRIVSRAISIPTRMRMSVGISSVKVARWSESSMVTIQCDSNFELLADSNRKPRRDTQKQRPALDRYRKRGE